MNRMIITSLLILSLIPAFVSSNDKIQESGSIDIVEDVSNPTMIARDVLNNVSSKAFPQLILEKEISEVSYPGLVFIINDLTVTSRYIYIIGTYVNETSGECESSLLQSDHEFSDFKELIRYKGIVARRIISREIGINEFIYILGNYNMFSKNSDFILMAFNNGFPTWSKVWGEPVVNETGYCIEEREGILYVLAGNYKSQNISSIWEIIAKGPINRLMIVALNASNGHEIWSKSLSGSVWASLPGSLYIDNSGIYVSMVELFPSNEVSFGIDWIKFDGGWSSTGLKLDDTRQYRVYVYISDMYRLGEYIYLHGGETFYNFTAEKYTAYMTRYKIKINELRMERLIINSIESNTYIFSGFDYFVSHYNNIYAVAHTYNLSFNGIQICSSFYQLNSNYSIAWQRNNMGEISYLTRPAAYDDTLIIVENSGANFNSIHHLIMKYRLPKYRLPAYILINATSPYGSISGSGWYYQGDNVTISLSTSKVENIPFNFLFSGWTDKSGNYVSTKQIYTFVANESEMLTAEWKREINITFIILGLIIISIATIIIKHHRRPK